MNAKVEVNHAEENAQGWASSIVEMVAALDGDGDNDDARAAIEQSVLSVEVRSGWYDAGTIPDAPEEFKILLTTGGPGLRIIGDLDGGMPSSARLEHQDWGTPWTESHVDLPTDTLLTFCQQFYFGE